MVKYYFTDKKNAIIYKFKNISKITSKKNIIYIHDKENKSV